MKGVKQRLRKLRSGENSTPLSEPHFDPNTQPLAAYQQRETTGQYSSTGSARNGGEPLSPSPPLQRCASAGSADDLAAPKNVSQPSSYSSQKSQSVQISKGNRSRTRAVAHSPALPQFADLRNDHPHVVHNNEVLSRLTRAGSDSELEMRKPVENYTPPEKEGMLFHRVTLPRGSRPWRRRWFVLENAKLSYFLLPDETVGSSSNDADSTVATTVATRYHVSDCAGTIAVCSTMQIDVLPKSDAANRILLGSPPSARSASVSEMKPFSFIIHGEELNADNDQVDNLHKALTDAAGVDVSWIDLEVAASSESELNDWLGALRRVQEAPSSSDISVMAKTSSRQSGQGFFQRGARPRTSFAAYQHMQSQLESSRYTASNIRNGPSLRESEFTAPPTKLGKSPCSPRPGRLAFENATPTAAFDRSSATSVPNSSIDEDGHEAVVIFHEGRSVLSLLEVPRSHNVDEAQTTLKMLQDEVHEVRSGSRLLSAGADPSALSVPTGRERVIDEIIATETVYGTHLKLLLKLYEVPLRFSVGGENETINGFDVDLIFGGIETIYNYSQALLKRLTEIATGPTWDSSRSDFSSAFVEMAPFFRSYFEYAGKFAVANTRMTELRNLSGPHRNEKFVEFCLSRKRVGVANSLDLCDLLITPIQRLPRYVLLLQSLLKETPEEHPDRANLLKASTQMQQNVEDMNRALGSAEQKAQLSALAAKNLADSFFVVLSPSRQFKLKADVRVVQSTKVIHSLKEQFIGSRNFDATIFLFSDAVLISRKKTNVLVEKILLETVSLGVAIEPLALTLTTARSLNYQLAFTAAAECSTWRDAIMRAQADLWQCRLQDVEDQLRARR